MTCLAAHCRRWEIRDGIGLHAAGCVGGCLRAATCLAIGWGLGIVAGAAAVAVFGNTCRTDGRLEDMGSIHRQDRDDQRYSSLLY